MSQLNLLVNENINSDGRTLGHKNSLFSDLHIALAGLKGENAGIWYSTDGINWSQSNVKSGNVRCIEKLNLDSSAYYLAAVLIDDYTMNIYSSLDGITWNSFNLEIDADTKIINYGKIVVGDNTAVFFVNNRIYYTTNGIDWLLGNFAAFEEDITVYTGWKLNYIAATNKYFYQYTPGSFCKGFAYSDDGINWHPCSYEVEMNTGWWSDVVYCKGKYCVSSTSGDSLGFLHSSDGISWEKSQHYTNVTIGEDVLAGNDNQGFVCIYDGKIITSINGDTWKETYDHSNGILYANDNFLSYSYYNGAFEIKMTAKNSFEWETVYAIVIDTPTTDPFKARYFNDTMWIIHNDLYGDFYAMITNTDTGLQENWVQTQLGARESGTTDFYGYWDINAATYFKDELLFVTDTTSSSKLFAMVSLAELSKAIHPKLLGLSTSLGSAFLDYQKLGYNRISFYNEKVYYIYYGNLLNIKSNKENPGVITLNESSIFGTFLPANAFELSVQDHYLINYALIAPSITLVYNTAESDVDITVDDSSVSIDLNIREKLKYNLTLKSEGNGGFRSEDDDFTKEDSIEIYELTEIKETLEGLNLIDPFLDGEDYQVITQPFKGNIFKEWDNLDTSIIVKEDLTLTAIFKEIPMAGNTRIRLFRGSKAKMLESENGEIILEDGQPFYNKTDNYLYIGDGKTPLKNIKALDVAGNVKLGTTNGTTDTTDRQPDHIFEENSNVVKYPIANVNGAPYGMKIETNGTLTFNNNIIPYKKLIASNLNAVGTASEDPSQYLYVTVPGVVLENNKHYIIEGVWKASYFRTQYTYDYYTKRSDELWNGSSMNVIVGEVDMSIFDFAQITVSPSFTIENNSTKLTFSLASGNASEEFTTSNECYIYNIYEVIE